MQSFVRCHVTCCASTAAIDILGPLTRPFPLPLYGYPTISALVIIRTASLKNKHKRPQPAPDPPCLPPSILELAPSE
jgi:hypothetical protein